jgi:hypothetical protein
MSLPVFQQIQLAFAAHLRDPQQAPAPSGIADARLQIYRDLFYHNIEGFIASALPMCRQLLKDQAWQNLVRDFYAQHDCQSPYFLDISREFIDYLWLERDEPQDLIFLKELALYEWLDLHAQINDALPAPYEALGDLCSACPVVSPWLVLQSFYFPVQHINIDHQPLEPLSQPIFLAVYRDLQDIVQMVELNAVSARCLSLLQQQALSGEQMLDMVATELAYVGEEKQRFLKFGVETLQQWHRKDILLGTQPC